MPLPDARFRPDRSHRRIQPHGEFVQFLGELRSASPCPGLALGFNLYPFACCGFPATSQLDRATEPLMKSRIGFVRRSTGQ